MEREENIRDNIIKLPKVELHCHLDGSLSREFVEKRLGRTVQEAVPLRGCIMGCNSC